MLTNVVGCPPDEVHSGMAVTVTWEPLSDGRQLPLFRPASGTGRERARGQARRRGAGHAARWWAARIPDRLALITPHGDRTYEDLNAEINRLARALRARGLQPGDAVALMCTNRPEFLEVLYAAQRIGLRLTPINWHLTGEEAAYIIENCEAKAFVCSGELGDAVTVAAAAGGAGNGEDQHRRLPARLRDVQHRGRRRGRVRHRRPGHRHPDALHLGHHRAAQGRAPRHRRGRARWPPSTSAVTTRTGRRASTPTS